MSIYRLLREFVLEMREMALRLDRIDPRTDH